jgi:hypothetical protein
MRRQLIIGLLWGVLCTAQNASVLNAQEAHSGFDLRGTVTAQTVISNELTEEPRSGSIAAPGFRSAGYPTWKINDNWFATGVLQLVSRPYFYEDFATTGYGLKGNVLQAALNYSRVSDKGSLLVRAGVMTTAFGSFLLRYDDAENPLVDLPIEYGYYYAPVSILGVAGAEVDATRGKWDGRLQFANSSPANPRSLFAQDQYGNWAGGAGYTVRQGLRIGGSAYRGPYLSRNYKFFFPGEANPNLLPAHALGVDADWIRHHSSVRVEGQRFVMPYTMIPTFRESAAYGEFKQALSARWYLAARAGYMCSSATGKARDIETATGFRPNRHQLIKLSYEFEHYSRGYDSNENTLALQIVTTFHIAAGRE